MHLLKSKLNFETPDFYQRFLSQLGRFITTNCTVDSIVRQLTNRQLTESQFADKN